MKIVPSERVGKLATGIFMELANKKQEVIKQGIDVIDLSVGSPDLPPPSFVIDTLIQYAKDPSKYGYTLKSQIDYGTFYPILKAAEKALTEDASLLAEQVKEYEARRDALLSGLEEGGWKVPKSSATMFVWAGIPDGWKSRDFSFELLKKAGVAVVPGDAFGKEGEGYVRMALVQPPKKLAEAANRIRLFLQAK